MARVYFAISASTSPAVMLVDLAFLLVDICPLFSYFPFVIHYGSVAVLDSCEKFILDVHVMAQFGICCSSGKPSYDVEHIVIVGIFLFVDIDDMVVELVGPVLVEYAEHLFKPVVDMSVQTGYLYNDAVVYKALDKGVWQALSNFVPVVVV